MTEAARVETSFDGEKAVVGHRLADLVAFLFSGEDGRSVEHADDLVRSVAFPILPFEAFSVTGPPTSRRSSAASPSPSTSRPASKAPVI